MSRGPFASPGSPAAARRASSSASRRAASSAASRVAETATGLDAAASAASWPRRHSSTVGRSSALCAATSSALTGKGCGSLATSSSSTLAGSQPASVQHLGRSRRRAVAALRCDGHHEMIAGAGGGDVQQPESLVMVHLLVERLRVVKVVGAHPLTELDRPALSSAGSAPRLHAGVRASRW